METTKRTTRISFTTAALIVAVVLLASSTIYLALLVKPSAPGGTSSTDGYKAYPIPYVGNSVQAASGSGTSTATDSITVSGAGAVSYTSNEALVTVSVVTTNKTAEEATSSDAATTLKVIKALNGIGVSNSSIGTQGYSLNANYANCYSSCTPQITGYSVTNSLQVNITSSSPSKLGEQAGRAIDTAVAAGANQVYLNFAETSSVLAGLTSSALQQAVASAYGQAHTIASSMGVNITGVISASEGSSYAPQYYAGVPEVLSAATSVSTPIMPGTQSMTVSVQVVYAIG